MKPNRTLEARAWLRDVGFPIIKPALLTREQFVAKYMPQYVRDYSPPTGIRLNARARPMMSSRGSVQAQVTKREHRIDECFAVYLSDYASAVEWDRNASKSTPSLP